MSISIVNTTVSDSPSFGGRVDGTASFNLSIPSTTLGNTLIVLFSGVGGWGTFGNAGSSAILDVTILSETVFFTEASGASQAVVGGPGSAKLSSAIWYLTGIPAGVTSVKVHTRSGPNCNLRVLEVSGINQIAPLENASGSHADQTSASSYTGPTINSAFSNALYVAAYESISVQPTGGNWTSANGASSNKKAMTKISTGNETPSFTWPGSDTKTSLISTATFNPTATVLTLSLSDGVSSADDLGNAAAFVSAQADSISFSELLNFVLSVNGAFKTLTDTLTMSDAIALLHTILRTFTDEIILSDNATFQRSMFRIISDTITIQDWISVKRSGSNWSN